MKLQRMAQMLLLTALTACSTPEPAPDGILLDGLFDEWSEAVTIIDDAPDAPDAQVDFLSVQGLDEPAWLFLAVDVVNEITLQSLTGTVHLLLDTDSDEGTGGPVHGMDGVDLIIDFSQTAEPRVEGRGLGFAMRVVSDAGATRMIARHSLGLTTLPTSSAPRFELRLSRRGSPEVAPFGSSVRLAVVYAEDGRELDRTTVGSYAFRTSLGEPTSAAIRARLAKAPGSIRVAQWNVAWQRFPSSLDDFARVLAALEPDVILLDELPAYVGGDPGVTGVDPVSIDADQIAEWLASEPLAGLGTWGFVLGESGGIQRALVAARDRDIRPAQTLTRVDYPQGALETLMALMPEDQRASRERETQGGVPVAGAWVDVGGQEALFVALDLVSRGWLGSPRDVQRTMQATRVREQVVLERGDSGAPVIIAGDLNLVGSRGPLFALVRGLDVDGSDLVPVDAERLGERSITTWRDPRDVFSPGRLDYVLVPDAVMSVVNSFVFATDNLDEPTLERLGLERDLSLRLSDHLVTVVDLRLEDGT